VWCEFVLSTGAVVNELVRLRLRLLMLVLMLVLVFVMVLGLFYAN
jgi:hypothetical protein